MISSYCHYNCGKRPSNFHHWKTGTINPLCPQFLDIPLVHMLFKQFLLGLGIRNCRWSSETCSDVNNFGTGRNAGPTKWKVMSIFCSNQAQLDFITIHVIHILTLYSTLQYNYTSFYNCQRTLILAIVLKGSATCQGKLTYLDMRKRSYKMFHSTKVSPEATGTHIFDTVLSYCSVQCMENSLQYLSVKHVTQPRDVFLTRTVPTVFIFRDLNADEQAPLGSLKRL